MKKPNITEGKWRRLSDSGLIIAKNDEITICDCDIDSFVIGVEYEANIKAITQVPDLIKNGLKLLEKAESFDEFGAIAEKEIEAFRKTLENAGCAE